jgi:hypothetical protein
MAAHGGEYKGFRSQGLQLGYNSARALSHIGDAAGTTTHRNTHTGLYTVADILVVKLKPDSLGDIINSGCFELLPHSHHSGQLDIESAGDINLNSITDHLMLPILLGGGSGSGSGRRLNYC